MHQLLITLGMLVGGLGLFLLAVSMISDGLRSAAAGSLRNILSGWTRSTRRGIFTGLLMTAVVQSSSAITVASIGFVNAGLLSIRQALGIVYGANIGTTMTGWLVALLGFKIDVQAFALPLIGLGMLLRFSGADTKRASFGVAIVGFGLFFLGIDVLKDAFEELVTAIDLSQFVVEGITGIVVFVLVGILMTVLTQSSSAAIAITITAAASGMLSLHVAAAMVIGANVGTTSTAAIAAISATSNAKRVASAQIIFNVITAIVALLILPLMLMAVSGFEQLLNIAAEPAISLALFHTLLNVLGVLLILPFNHRLVRFLERRFVSDEETASHPLYLDQAVAVTPVLAVNALVLELTRMMEIAGHMALAVLDPIAVNTKALACNNVILQRLSAAVSQFISGLERVSLSREVTDQLAMLLRVEQYILASAELSLQIASVHKNSDFSEADSLHLSERASFYTRVTKLLVSLGITLETFSLTQCEDEFQQLRQDYDALKDALLLAGTELRIPIATMMVDIDQNSRIQRLSEQLIKAVRLLDKLHLTTELRSQPENVSNLVHQSLA